MSETAEPRSTLDIREQISPIDDLIIDTQTKQRAYHMEPWKVGATLAGGAAAFFAAGAALVKLAGG